MEDILADYLAIIRKAVREYLCKELRDKYYRSFSDIRYVISVPTAYSEADQGHHATIRSAWTRNDLDDRLTLVNSHDAMIRSSEGRFALHHYKTVPIIDARYSTAKVAVYNISQNPLRFKRKGYRRLTSDANRAEQCTTELK